VSLGKKQDYISKTTRAKRAGGMPQAVEHLSSKCKALSSNPSPAKFEKMLNCNTIIVRIYGVQCDNLIHVYDMKLQNEYN
jgi:hypothetical protein